MKRPQLNFMMDALAFAGFVLLTTTGVLMRYLLPPGSGHWTTIWGLDRHEWGAVHFWIALGFLAVLGIHLFLHRRWILSVLRGRPREGSGLRVGLGLVGLMAVVAIAVAPLVSPVERADGRGGERGRAGAALSESIRGSTSLRELERMTGVRAADIVAELGLPPDVSLDERLGPLSARYGFQMRDVRRIARERQMQRRP